MLTQLIEQIQASESIPQRFNKLEEMASTPPTRPEEIISLLNLTRFRLDEKDFPSLKQTEVFVAFLECKQVLVESGDYYFI